MSCASCNENNFVPFKVKLAPGESNFYLDLPDNVLDCKFTFADLDLTPSFYSLQAAQMKLNADDEFTAPLAEPMLLKIKYRKKFTDVPEYVGENEEVKDFLNDFNSFAEQHRPGYAPRPYCFIDWVHVDADDRVPRNLNEYVRENSERLFSVDDPVQFLNAWPDSLNEVSFKNDYVLPDGFENLDKLRIRICVAPYATVTLRSQDIVDTLGFAGQIEMKNRQYKISNAAGVWRPLVAKAKPKKLFDRTGWKIDIAPTDVVASPTHYLLISKAMLTKPSLLAYELNEGLKFLETKVNLSLKAFYTREDGRYQFRFPDSKNVDVNVSLPKAVASVLGFADNNVTRKTKSLPISQDDDNFDTLKLCRALANDTSAVVVTQKNWSACNLVGSTHRYLATLKPTAVGTMCLLKLDSCTPPLKLYALNPSEIPAHRIVEFQMSTFDDTRNMVPLNWPCSSYLQGMLVGRRCLCPKRL